MPGPAKSAVCPTSYTQVVWVMQWHQRRRPDGRLTRAHPQSFPAIARLGQDPCAGPARSRHLRRIPPNSRSYDPMKMWIYRRQARLASAAQLQGRGELASDAVRHSAGRASNECHCPRGRRCGCCQHHQALVAAQVFQQASREHSGGGQVLLPAAARRFGQPDAHRVVTHDGVPRPSTSVPCGPQSPSAAAAGPAAPPCQIFTSSGICPGRVCVAQL